MNSNPQPQPHNPVPYGYYPPVQQMQNGMGISALVLGLVTLPFAFIPFVGFGAWIFALITLLLGFTGARKAQAGLATNEWMGWTGVGLALTELVLPIVMIIIVSAQS